MRVVRYAVRHPNGTFKAHDGVTPDLKRARFYHSAQYASDQAIKGATVVPASVTYTVVKVKVLETPEGPESA